MEVTSPWTILHSSFYKRNKQPSNTKIGIGSICLCLTINNSTEFQKKVVRFKKKKGHDFVTQYIYKKKILTVLNFKRRSWLQVDHSFELHGVSILTAQMATSPQFLILILLMIQTTGLLVEQAVFSSNEQYYLDSSLIIKELRCYRCCMIPW